MKPIRDIFCPNKSVTREALLIVALAEAILFLVMWLLQPFAIIPKPFEVLTAFTDLWSDGLAVQIMASFQTNLEAIGITLIISLAISYLSVLPAVRPITGFVSKGRFFSMTGFTVIFTLLTGGGHTLKISLLVFGMTVFFVTSMAAVIMEIPREQFDHARTLRMHEWRVVWEVVILGKFDQVFEVLRQNAAIGWMMLTMVEGLVRSEGGIGAMLLSENKHFKLSAVFAIQFIVLIIGIGQDFGIAWLKDQLCPYAKLSLERSK